MDTFELVEKWIAEDKFRFKCLMIAREYFEQDWFLAAGFVRNLVWDKLQGHKEMTALNDIDLIYFNPSCISKEQDQIVEEALNAEMPKCNWSVKNQARMALNHGHDPYLDCIEAMSYWPEVQTAIGVTLLKEGGIRVRSPFSAHDVVRLAATRNLKCTSNAFNSRLAKKGWEKLWPELAIET